MEFRPSQTEVLLSHLSKVITISEMALGNLKISYLSPPILDLDEANGNLLTDDATRNVSPQRGTPQSDNR